MRNTNEPRESPEPESRAPLLRALQAQIVGLGAALLASFVLQGVLPLPLWAWALLQGSVAMIVAMRMGLPRWWWGISLGFVPMAVLAQGLTIPPFVWLIGFVLLLLVFWRTDTSRVPLYMTNASSADAVAKLLLVAPCRCADLGCGDGSLLLRLARLRPDCQFVGFEHAPLTWLWAKFRGRKQANLQICYGSFWRQDLSSYDVIYAFLSPVPMPRLWEKLSLELRPGAKLVSNSFPIPGVRPEVKIEVNDARQTELWVYPGSGH